LIVFSFVRPLNDKSQTSSLQQVHHVTANLQKLSVHDDMAQGTLRTTSGLASEAPPCEEAPVAIASAAMSLAERKHLFNTHVREGKAREADSDWSAALTAYTAAAAVFPDRDDLAKKMGSLAKKVALATAVAEAVPLDAWFSALADPVHAADAGTAASAAVGNGSSGSGANGGRKGWPVAEVFLPGGYRLPRWVYDGIYEYQRQSLHWMWSLHTGKTCAGGILGDDMGLGKTVQIATYLNGTCIPFVSRFTAYILFIYLRFMIFIHFCLTIRCSFILVFRPYQACFIRN
jgi:hypothetical protein